MSQCCWLTHPAGICNEQCVWGSPGWGVRIKTYLPLQPIRNIDFFQNGCNEEAVGKKQVNAVHFGRKQQWPGHTWTLSSKAERPTEEKNRRCPTPLNELTVGVIFKMKSIPTVQSRRMAEESTKGERWWRETAGNQAPLRTATHKVPVQSSLQNNKLSLRWINC